MVQNLPALDTTLIENNVGFTERDSVFLKHLDSKWYHKEEQLEILNKARIKEWYEPLKETVEIQEKIYGHTYAENMFILFLGVLIILLFNIWFIFLFTKMWKKKISKYSWYKKNWIEDTKYWWHRLFQIVWIVFTAILMIMPWIWLFEGNKKYWMWGVYERMNESLLQLFFSLTGSIILFLSYRLFVFACRYIFIWK